LGKASSNGSANARTGTNHQTNAFHIRSLLKQALGRARISWPGFRSTWLRPLWKATKLDFDDDRYQSAVIMTIGFKPVKGG
jgi:hypothetical protein